MSLLECAARGFRLDTHDALRMFSWIRWHSLRRVLPPAPPVSPLHDDTVHFYTPTDEVPPACGAYCKQQIRGVRCCITDDSHGAVLQK